MSDIVGRLRKENSMPPYYGPPKLQEDAAAEIERLRAALEFYAGGEWSDGYPGGVKVDDNTLDFGDIARAALEGE